MSEADENSTVAARIAEIIAERSVAYIALTSTMKRRAQTTRSGGRLTNGALLDEKGCGFMISFTV